MLCGQKLIAKHVLQSEEAKSDKSILLISTDTYSCSSATLVQDGRRGTQRKTPDPLEACTSMCREPTKAPVIHYMSAERTPHGHNTW